MNSENIKVIEGKRKIILSAPHSVLHMRENNIRPRETRTGTIVQELAKRCKTYAIYKTKNEYNDANWDSKCKYKEKLKKIVEKENIKALIDVHGMAAYRKQDICIGINDGKNIYGNTKIVNRMISTFNKYGFKNVTVDIPFAAKNENCVSTYIAKNCKIPAFQIEINLKYRSSKYKEYSYYGNLIKAMQEIIDLMSIDILK